MNTQDEFRRASMNQENYLQLADKLRKQCSQIKNLRENYLTGEDDAALMETVADAMETLVTAFEKAEKDVIRWNYVYRNSRCRQTYMGIRYSVFELSFEGDQSDLRSAIDKQLENLK